MRSWEVLREAVEAVGVKAVAARLRVSAALVYKWCQEPPTNDDPISSGARNPLDRLEMILRATGDPRLVHWLCEKAGGFYAPNPDINPRDTQGELLGATQRVVEDFGNLLGQISRSVEDDGQISAVEAEHIRRSWERLKSQGESFIVACEEGMYMRKAPAAEKR